VTHPVDRRRPLRLVGVVLLALLGLVGVGGGPGAVADAGLIDSSDATAPTSTDAYEVQTDIAYDSTGLKLDAYLPRDGRTDRPALVMVHGGGWEGGDKDAYGGLAEKAAADQGWAVFAVNYRLDGDDPTAWPDEVEDVNTAVRFVADNAQRFGIDPGQMMLMGGSAGANLSALVGSLGPDRVFISGSPDPSTISVASPARIRAVALWSPPVDLAPLVPPDGGGPPSECDGDPACDYIWSSPVIEKYLNCTPAQCPETYRDASPTNWVTSDTPPTSLVNSKEEVVPLDQVQAYVSKLADAGVAHDFLELDGDRHSIQYSDDAWAPTVEFLSAHLGAQQSDSTTTSVGAVESATAPAADDGSSFPWIAVVVVVIVVGAGAAGVVAVRRR
jgi:acetyl esterase